MFKRLSLLLTLFLLCIVLTPSQTAFARFNSLPDFFGVGGSAPNDSSWPVDASATCTTITVSLSYPDNDNPFGIPHPYDSVTWSLERVLVNGTQEVSVVEADKTIYTFPHGTPGGEDHSRTFTLTTPLEAGTGLFIEVRYLINGGNLGGGTGVFDVGDFDHPYWHMRAFDPAHSQDSPNGPDFGIDQHFCDDNSSAPNVYVLGDVARNEGNGGLQTYQFKLFLDKPTDKPVRIDLESTTAAGLPNFNPDRPSFNGYSSRGIRFGSSVCVDSGDPTCIIPTYTTIIIPPGQTQVDLPIEIGSDTAPEVFLFGLHNFSIIRVANAKFGGQLSGVLAARNDDGCNEYSPPNVCFLTLHTPSGPVYEQQGDFFSFLVSNQVVDETAGSVTFPVTLTQAAAQTVEINYETTSTGYNATAGVDYTPVNGTLTFAPGVVSQNIVVPIIANPEAEGLEAFGLKVAKTNATTADDVTVGALIVNDYAAPPTNTPVGTEAVTPPAQSPTPTATNDPVGEEQDLLVNGDFERKDANGKPKLDPWKVRNESADKVKCNKPAKDAAQTGDCAYRFKGTTNEDTVLSQKVELDTFIFAANDKLTLDAYVNAKQSPKGKLKLVVRYTDSSLEKSKLELDLHQTTGYERFEGTVTLLSGDLASIKVTISHRTTSGKVFMDSVRLIQTSAAPLVPLP
jgi:hypothetical protein